MFVGDNMNNKGFTLIELLATIVILGIIMGIATLSVIGIINRSKERGEAMFANNLGDSIQSFIADNRLRWDVGVEIGTFKKCNMVDDSGNCVSKGKNTKQEDKKLYTISGTDIYYSSFSLEKLISGNYIRDSKLINPKNKLDCNKNGRLASYIYKDSDSVYYYYVDLNDGGTCDVSDKNSIVSNIPKNVCGALLEEGYTWKEDVCKK